MPRNQFVVKEYDGNGSDGYAIFKASQVRSIGGDKISWEDGIEPFRGYYGLSKIEAYMYKEKLEKELK